MSIAIATADLGLMSIKDLVKPLPEGFKCGVTTTVKATVDGVPQNVNHQQMFQDRISTLTAKVKPSIPELGKNVEYQKAIQAIIDIDKRKSDAVKSRDEISKGKPPNQDALKKSNQNITDIEAELQKAIKHGSSVAKKILDQADTQALLSDGYDDSDLVALTVLTEATTTKLAKWCDQSPGHAKQLLDFLDDVTLMRKFLMSGGAKNGEYPRAVEIFNQIQPNPSSPVLERLALAVALELCSPVPVFHRTWLSVDPLKRYLHYEQAYLLGELDADFSRFNVWEMRQIVNSDASDEELAWGRQSLINYRPDIVNTENAQWKYCMIVKTDVGYCNVDWYKEPKTFDQILSGGGQCGPRAWYGRFICKAFGIPTFGFKQPGHAAMSRWTLNGWCTCLGAGFQYSNWEDECGNNFQLTTQAMRACGSETVFMNKVRRIEWIARILNEDSRSVKGSFVPSTKSLWWSLSFFQRQLLAPGASAANIFMFPRIDVTPNVYLTLKSRSIDRGIIEYRETEKAIVIPAPCCSSPTTTTNKVLFFRSYLGGQQLYIKENGTVEYKLQSPIIKSTPTKYSLTCRVCTAHRRSKPITLVVCTDGKFSHPISIDLPYTVCMWGETTPVIIELGGPNVTTNLLRFVRENEPYGFGIKDIRLTVVETGYEIQ